MKIRRVRHMRIDELIKYSLDNEIYPTRYYSTGNRFEVNFSSTGTVSILDYAGSDKRVDISKGTTFINEVEEEITNETELEDVTVLTKIDGSIYPVYAKLSSISDVKRDIADDDTEILKIFANIDGKPTLVWDGEDK